MQKPSGCLKCPCVIKRCSAKRSLIPLFYIKNLQRGDAWYLGCQNEWKDDGLNHIESRICIVKTAQTGFMLMLLVSGHLLHREGGASEKNAWTPGTAEKHKWLGFSSWVGIYLLMSGEVILTVQLEEWLHGRRRICMMAWEGSPLFFICWTRSALLFLLGHMESSETLVRGITLHIWPSGKEATSCVSSPLFLNSEASLSHYTHRWGDAHFPCSFREVEYMGTLLYAWAQAM